MKCLLSLSITMALFLLAGCHKETPAPPPPTPATAASASAPAANATTEYEFGSDDLNGPAMTLEDFLKTCEKQSGMNFTYAADTKQELSTTKLQIFGKKRVRSDEFEKFLGTMLEINGFQAEHIGPEHLHVLLVKRRVG